MEITTNTKVCNKCGNELPISQFYAHRGSKDGYLGHCKRCHLDIAKTKRDKAKQICADSQNPLSTFTPRELIEELRKRGYRGTLSIVREVVL